MNPERTPAPDQRLISLHPRIPRFACQKILSDHTSRLADKLQPATRYLSQRPRKLVVGTAAATVAAAGLTAAVATAGAAPVVGAIGTPGAVSYSGAVHRATHQTASARLASDQGARQRTVSQHAAGKHEAAPKTRHAAPQRTATHRAVTHHKVTQHTVVRHAASHHAARHVIRWHRAPAPKPYLIYDSTTPSAIPAHRNAAVYATGNYAASPDQMGGRDKVLWIDTTGGDQHASVLDVEPGDATPAAAASWARSRLAADPNAVARLYTFRNEWPAVQSAVQALPQQMQSRIRWWIADPTGVPHIVPGSAATQWYWGSSYDITTASPRF
jgi:hypothetical protein